MDSVIAFFTVSLIAQIFLLGVIAFVFWKAIRG